VKNILRLLGYDMQKLGEQIFLPEVLKEDDYVIGSKNNLTIARAKTTQKKCTEVNAHERDDSLTNYCLLLEQWRILTK
jgi:hypothetical protein